MELKKKIFQRLDELAAPDTILATNTSALSITEIAASARQKSRTRSRHPFFQSGPPDAARRGCRRPPDRRRNAPARGAICATDRQIARGRAGQPRFSREPHPHPYLVEAGNLFEAGAGIGDHRRRDARLRHADGSARLLDEVGIDVALRRRRDAGRKIQRPHRACRRSWAK